MGIGHWVWGKTVPLAIAGRLARAVSGSGALAREEY